MAVKVDPSIRRGREREELKEAAGSRAEGGKAGEVGKEFAPRGKGKAEVGKDWDPKPKSRGGKVDVDGGKKVGENAWHWDGGKGKLSVDLLLGDPGITATYDASKGRLTLRGSAEGPEKVGPGGLGGQVSRGVTVTLGKDQMPDFSKDPDYRRKNRWFFSHTGSATTVPGMSPRQVATAIATELNKGGAIDAKVERHDDGSASITFSGS